MQSEVTAEGVLKKLDAKREVTAEKGATKKSLDARAARKQAKEQARAKRAEERQRRAEARKSQRAAKTLSGDDDDDATEGEDCESDWDCEGDLECVDDECRVHEGEEGEPCKDDDGCNADGGLQCMPVKKGNFDEGVCERDEREDGERCWDDFNCDEYSGLECRDNPNKKGEKHCFLPTEDGDRCMHADECARDSYCVRRQGDASGKIMECSSWMLQVGDECNTNDCDEGLVCDATSHKCRHKEG